MERSLVLIKPDAMERDLAGAIIARLQKQGLKMVGIKMLHMDTALAEEHYAVHQDKSFFGDLVKYITSTPIIAAAFAGEDAVAVSRKLMGATDPAKAEAGTIRGDFGLDIEHKKPAPDIFLKAARLLGKDPAHCLVVEDAISGVAAGKAAGARVLALTTSFSPADLAGADWITRTLGTAADEVLEW